MGSMIALWTGDDALRVGEVLPLDRYLTTDDELASLGAGGTLYLVAPGPKHELLLVAVLEAPARSRIFKGDRRADGWYAAPNTVPVTNISRLRARLKLGPKSELAAALATALPVTPSIERKLRAMFDADGDAPVIEAVAPSEPRGFDLVAAIRELAELWRATRSVEVADLIDRATRQLPRYDRPLLVAMRDEAASHEVWMRTWETERDEAMPQLLRNLSIRHDRERPARLRALTSAPDDPRVSRSLVRLVQGYGTLPLATLIRRAREQRSWQDLADMLQEIDDTRYPQLREQLAFAAGWTELRSPRLDADAAARVRAIAEAVDAAAADRTEHALVDAIGEHPDDDGPYLVYSDWLLERGHPRGEYIALVCKQRRGGLSSALARRLAALEEVPDLMGPLDGIATSHRRPRERGIDRTLDVYSSTMNLTWLEVAAHPLVRVLEALHLVGYERDRTTGLAAVARAAPRLRRIDNIGTRHARALASELGAGWRADGGDLVRRP